MASFQVEICNLALARIGVAAQLTSIDERRPEALVCKTFYNITRDRVIRSLEWPFCKKTVTLALVAEQPTDEWGYAYTYPADCVRMLRFVSGNRVDADAQYPYSIAYSSAGRVIYTDAVDPVLEYITNVTNEAQYDPHFVDALVWCLAAEIAGPLTKDVKLADYCRNNYRMSLAEAGAMAKNENRQEDAESSFIRAGY